MHTAPASTSAPAPAITASPLAHLPLLPFENITVLLADPRQDDPGWTPHDDEELEHLKEALSGIPNVTMSWLDTHATLLERFKSQPPAFIFNLCDEGYNNVNEWEPYLPALMDMHGIPYTGTGAIGLTLCRDKWLVDSVAKALNIAVPFSHVFEPNHQTVNEFIETHVFTFPVIVKPRCGDGSTGITSTCICNSTQELAAHLEDLGRQEELASLAMLVQQFLAGREITVACLGNPDSGDFRVLPILELDYTKLPPDAPKIQLYDAKRGMAPEFWEQVAHIHAQFDDATQALIEDHCAKIFDALSLQDYARIDFRFDDSGTPHLLDVNPNCWIGGKFRRAGQLAGLEWPHLLESVVRAAWTRHQRRPDAAALTARVLQRDAPTKDPQAILGQTLKRLQQPNTVSDADLATVVNALATADFTSQQHMLDTLVSYSAARQEQLRIDLPDPPIARRSDGPDEYAWMQATSSEEFQTLIDDEYDYAEEVMAPTADFQEQLVADMLQRMPTRPPFAFDIKDHIYFSIQDSARHSMIHGRLATQSISTAREALARASDDSDTRRALIDLGATVLLDEAQYAAEHNFDFCDFGQIILSPQGQYFGYTVDDQGEECYKLHIINVDSLEPVTVIDDVSAEFFFTQDGQGVFYSGIGETMPNSVFLHQLHGNVPPQVVFQETDAAFAVTLHQSSDGNYLIIDSASQSTSECLLLPTDLNVRLGGAAAWLCVVSPRTQGVNYTCDVAGNTLFMRTNRGDAKNHQLEAATCYLQGDRIALGDFSVCMAAREHVQLQEVIALDGYVAMVEQSYAAKQIRLMHFTQEDGVVVVSFDHYISFPHLIYSFWSITGGCDPMRPGRGLLLPSQKAENVRLMTLFYSSPICPTQLLTYDPDTRRFDIKFASSVINFEAFRYKERRLTAISQDGTQVPISLIYNQAIHTEKPRNQPCVLYGYGAYGSSVELNFSPAVLSLLDRGVVYAVAHVRGGSELGATWYFEGRREHKKNSFFDMIACAEHLVTSGITSKSKLALTGRSAGGLLVGAVLNMRPDLCAAALLKVPFLDVVTTVQDASAPYTAYEYEEWGDPEDPIMMGYMRSYCPYTNLRPGKTYPYVMCVTATNDNLVSVAQPTKWVHRLRQVKGDWKPVLLRANSGGHMGQTGLDHYHDLAFEHAFLLQHVAPELGVRQLREIQPRKPHGRASEARRPRSGTAKKYPVVRFQPQWSSA
ncbi:uncharacterized protein MONBRDRAFT_25175 [Monosiga brevicollis MX1]|uniref:Prolyl endopeptidase-like n=1 Tax=Monosiga brevicollis TaxID=81824 RepID=A9UYM3_MONBE|nr:uncharacterized protein MONBRDRAFT_25175 [Monosiga brevicollis MX1]EDQ89629.1 predicted protein [Monosiga brevicollis MX1]|eukprot:XP_001745658.1 hypothetical protein [Monosiga brevicollis MX1]